MKFLLSVFFILSLAACSSTPKPVEAGIAPDYALDPMLYKLTKGPLTYYIVGTVHDEIKEIPAKLRPLILQSDLVVSEGTLNEADTDISVMKSFPEKEFKVSPDVMAAAVDSLQGSVQLDELKKLNPFELWLRVDENTRAWELVKEELSNHLAQNPEPATPVAFLDLALWQFAKENGIKRKALEPFSDETLQRCEQLTSVVFLEKMAFDKGFQKSPKPLEKATANMDEGCIQKRNQNWFKIINDLGPTHPHVFIAIGVSHIALKEPNLITLFKQNGYQAELMPKGQAKLP
jgi:uncharacterized protein YbaP (TraB family)